VLSPQEYREHADQCIGWARAAVSDSERKLYRQLAVTWLENAVRLEPRAIELPSSVPHPENEHDYNDSAEDNQPIGNLSAGY